jgi:hypothetical protein
MTFDVRTYTGNVRIDSISFDTLAQLYEGDLQCYDPADNESDKHYVGKVGVLVQDSYLYDKDLRCASVQVKFRNGYTLLVADDDVVATYDGDTAAEFLPAYNEPTSDEGFRELTQDEKDFADKALLQMIVANAHQPEQMQKTNERLLARAIYLSMCRTRDYSMIWRIPDDNIDN